MRTNVTAAHLEALSKPYVQLASLFEFELPGDPAYLHAGWGTLVVDGRNYLGTAQLGQVAATRETLAARISGASYTLSGLESADVLPIIAAIKAIPPWQDIAVRQKMAVFDPVKGRAIGAAIPLREDIFDVAARQFLVDSVQLLVTAEPPGADRGAIGPPRFTPEGQRAEFPDDTGMDRQPQVGQQPIDLAR